MMSGLVLRMRSGLVMRDRGVLVLGERGCLEVREEWPYSKRERLLSTDSWYCKKMRLYSTKGGVA